MISCQPGAIRRALEEAGLGIMDVDGIAYTRGPGKRSTFTARPCETLNYVPTV